MKFKKIVSIFILFTAISRVNSLDNCFEVINHSLIKFIKSGVNSKINLKNASSKIIGYEGSIFALNKSNKQEIFVLIPVFCGDMTKFEEEIIVQLDVLNVINVKNIKEIISSNSKLIPNINEKFKIKKTEIFKILTLNNFNKFATWECLKENFKLKKYIDFKKYGYVYYTVPSEDKLDDLHIVYESGNEKKEFVFTNLPEKPIVPVEEVEKLEKKPEIKPKKTVFKNITNCIFSLFNNNCEKKIKYGHDEECEKLKND